MLIITMGDPHSINCEMVSSALENQAHLLRCMSQTQSVVLVGSLWHWRDQTIALGRKLPDFVMIHSLGEAPKGLSFLDVGGEERRASQLSAKERGTIAVKALQTISFPSPTFSILTCPIDKKACHDAGFPYPGHTEYFEALTKGTLTKGTLTKGTLGKSPALMLLAGKRLKVGLVTNHLAVADISRSLSVPLITRKLSILYKTLSDFFGIETPRVAVCGLNPHCSDGGLFGHEEETIITPAVEQFRLHSKLSSEFIAGPLPADTIFHKALSGQFDAVLAMYHDQGLGPLKTVHFDDAVNMSCGLPFLRMSPDHGPARDLFLKGQASRRSFDQAIEWIVRADAKS